MFSQFYQHHFELISKYMYNFGFKIRLQGGLSELEFNGDLVYKFKTIVCKTDFFRTNLKIVTRYKKTNMDILRQTECIVVKLIMVASFF